MVEICYLEIRYAEPYQPTSGRELKWLVITGIACAEYQVISKQERA